MPLASFSRDQRKFISRGMSLNRPLNLIGENQYAYLKNTRAYVEGQLTSRPGLTLIDDLGAEIHSHIRQNNFDPDLAFDWEYLAGATTGLYSGVTSFGSIASGFSGDPLSWVNFDPPASPASFVYVGDSEKMVKVGPKDATVTAPLDSSNVFPIGVPPPNDLFGVTLSSGVLTGDYSWRLRFRSSWSGAMSNPGPASVFITLTAQQATFNLDAAPSSDIDLVDVFRFGGTVFDWRLVGSGSPGGSFTDNTPDIDLLSAPGLPTNANGDFSIYQPFPTLDITRSGTADVSSSFGATVVTTISGDTFNDNWPSGTVMILDGQSVTFQTRPSANTVVINQTVTPVSGVSWKIISPVILGQPMSRLWGPYAQAGGASFMFAVGDPRLPGWLKWTNGNDFDSTDLINSLEITGPSEPLVNGCCFNGQAYVWSTERFFVIVPSLSVPGQFFVELISRVGLYAPWAVTVGKDGMYWVGKDGIYFSSGGPPVAITDKDLYPVFPHDALPPLPVAIPTSSGILAFDPPDPNHLESWRLLWYDGMVYFDYREFTSGEWGTFVRDEKNSAGGWSFDRYATSGRLTRSAEDDEHAVLVSKGTKLFTWGGVDDDGDAISARVISACLDQGDFRSRKLYGDSWFKSNPNGVTLSLMLYGSDNSLELYSGSTSSGVLEEKILDINFGLGTMALNISLDVQWSTHEALPELYEWQPSFIPRPEDTMLRATDWDDGGTTKAKYLRSVLIKADTGGVDRTVDILGDGGTVQLTLTVNHSGIEVKPYAILPTFVAHLVRLSPTNDAEWMLFPETLWIGEEYPELDNSVSPWSNAGYEGAKFVRGVRLKIDSQGSDAPCVINADGSETVVTRSFVANSIGQAVVPFAWTPFIASTLRLANSGSLRVWDPIEWDYDKYPEFSTEQTSVIKLQGCRFVQGLRLTTDTNGTDVEFQIYSEFGLQATITANTTGKTTIAFPRVNEITPFFAHEVWIIPLSPARLWSEDLEWISEPAPDLGTSWTTPPISGNFKNFWAMRYIWLGYAGALGGIACSVTLDDGTQETYTFPASGPGYLRSYAICKPTKSKIRSFRVWGGEAFRLYKQDSFILAKEWGRPYDNFSPLQVFGDTSIESGARI